MSVVSNLHIFCNWAATLLPQVTQGDIGAVCACVM